MDSIERIRRGGERAQNAATPFLPAGMVTFTNDAQLVRSLAEATAAGLAKTGARDRAQAVRYAYQHGLATPLSKPAHCRSARQQASTR